MRLQVDENYNTLLIPETDHEKEKLKSLIEILIEQGELVEYVKKENTNE